MSKDFRIACNWPTTHGDLNKNIEVKYSSKVTGPIRDWRNGDNLILLTKDDIIDEKCELTFNIKPTFNLNSMTIISDHNTVELFKGSLLEYYKTVQGDFISEYDGTRAFRIDLSFDDTSNLTVMSIRFITNHDSIWLFNMQIVLVENRNFLQNMLQSSATALPNLNPVPMVIDMKSVESRLAESNVEVSKNAGKCKELVESYTKMMSAAKLNGTINSFNMPNIRDDDRLNGNSSKASSGLIEPTVQSYIDKKFNDFEERMNAKLDKITCLLEEINNKN